MGRKQRWRFSLQITEGPNAGLGAGPWRLWVHRDDIYLAAAGQVDTIKVSLHHSGKWRVAYTTEHMSNDRPLWNKTTDRAPWKFAAPPFVEGVQEAFVVATVRAALRPVESDGRDAVVPVVDRWDRLTGVRVIVTQSSCPSGSAREARFPGAAAARQRPTGVAPGLRRRGPADQT